MQLIFMARNEANFSWPGTNPEDLSTNHFQSDEHTTPTGITSRDLSPDILKEAVDPNQIDATSEAVRQHFEDNAANSITILSRRLT